MMVVLDHYLLEGRLGWFGERRRLHNLYQDQKTRKLYQVRINLIFRLKYGKDEERRKNVMD